MGKAVIHCSVSQRGGKAYRLNDDLSLMISPVQHCTTAEPFPSLTALSSHLSVAAATGFAKSVRTSPHRFPLCFYHDPDCFLCPALRNHPTSPNHVPSFTLPTMFSQMYMSYPITSPFGEGSWSTEVNRLGSLSAQTGSPGCWFPTSLPVRWERGKARRKGRRNQEQQGLF